MQPALLRQLLRLALTQSLSRLLEDPGPVVIYVESWMLALFGENGEMLTTFQRRFRVSFDLQRVPRCGVLIFINGPPIFQILAALQILTVCFQFQVRRNRGSLQLLSLKAIPKSKNPWAWVLAPEEEEPDAISRGHRPKPKVET